MGRAIFGLALLAGLLPFVCAQPSPVKAEGFGPFPVRNFQPIQQLVLSMPGDRAAVLKQGVLDVRLELAETASVFRDEGPQASVTMKFETLRSGLFLRYGATERWELSVEVPVLYRYRGFMEGPIKTVERATTGLSPGRNALGNSGYAFNISRGGRTVASGREGAVGLGDSTVMSKYQLLQETASMPAVSIRTALKLPTGDEGQFFGSGSPDVGFGLAAEKGFGGRWVVYGNLNGVIPTGRIAGMHLQPTISGLVAVEWCGVIIELRGEGKILRPEIFHGDKPGYRRLEMHSCDTAGRNHSVEVAIDHPATTKSFFSRQPESNIRAAAPEKLSFVPRGKFERRTDRHRRHPYSFPQYLVLAHHRAVAQSDGTLPSARDGSSSA